MIILLALGRMVTWGKQQYILHTTRSCVLISRAFLLDKKLKSTKKKILEDAMLMELIKFNTERSIPRCDCSEKAFL